MKIILQSLVLLLTVLSAPTVASATYVQLADGVYQDGTTLYIGSYVTSLGDLQINPTVIYCYAAIPPACVSNTFTSYGAALHVPAVAMVSYFTAQYWNNFNNIIADAIAPQYVILDQPSAELELDETIALTPTVYPADATPTMVYWFSTNTAVATVDNGIVTAVGAGECDIIAACADKQAFCHVTVAPERVTITLDRHEARLLPNHTLTLNATCSPSAVDLAVTSSNPAVALPRLVNGTIMVVSIAEGTATITVNAADGWGNPDQCEVTVYTELGDVNCDGFVNIADVTNLIDYILGTHSAVTNNANADTNRDGMIGIADVTAIIDYILNGGVWPWEPASETFTVNGVTFKMVTVEGGTFTMGATPEQDSDANSNEKPDHEVTVSSYYIGETEVPQELWQAVMGSNPSYFSSSNTYAENLQRPVESVSWEDCQAFIAKLNQLAGKQFRLPTEAEWEFAARGGNRSQGYKYAGSNTIDDVAWYWHNIPSSIIQTEGFGTQTVATKAPNELGLYDMSGNVCEWCQDRYGDYTSEEQTNPTGLAWGTFRVNRGGSWGGHSNYCRVSCRLKNLTTDTDANYNLGLRLALDLDNSPKFRLSETVVTVFVGDSKTVEILNGDSAYTVEGGTENVTSIINGNTLTVTGTNEGTTTVHVTNTSTGATAVLTVIVKEHEWVDLGLPSGTLWATCNIGADIPEDYGDYFAWGETEPKDSYNWNTYKWCNGSSNTMTKYCTDSYYGTVDNKTELDPEDDAAYVNWGPSWRMPTSEQYRELVDNSTWTWETRNGVNGRLATGPNGNTIFMPAAGCRSWGELHDVGSYCYYWWRTLNRYYSNEASYMSFPGYFPLWCDIYFTRDFGLSVRAVRVS